MGIELVASVCANFNEWITLQAYILQFTSFYFERWHLFIVSEWTIYNQKKIYRCRFRLHKSGD